MNPSLVDRFASDASRSVQVSVANCIGVSISNPGHLSFSSSHVRSGKHQYQVPRNPSWPTRWQT